MELTKNVPFSPAKGSAGQGMDAGSGGQAGTLLVPGTCCAAAATTRSALSRSRECHVQSTLLRFVAFLMLSKHEMLLLLSQPC